MKKLLITLLVFSYAYCASASHKQDTTKVRQDTVKQHTKKKTESNKPIKRKKSQKNDTLRKNTKDTTVRLIK